MKTSQVKRIVSLLRRLSLRADSLSDNLVIYTGEPGFPDYKSSPVAADLLESPTGGWLQRSETGEGGPDRNLGQTLVDCDMSEEVGAPRGSYAIPMLGSLWKSA